MTRNDDFQQIKHKPPTSPQPADRTALSLNMDCRRATVANAISKPRRVLAGLLLCGCFAIQGVSALAQDDVDVQIQYDDSGRVVVLAESPIFLSEFPTSGIAKQFASDPGFVSETDLGLGIGANDEIAYNVLDDLLFWDGVLTTTTTAAANVQLRIAHTLADDTYVHATSGEQLSGFSPPANVIGQAQASGDFHAHLQFYLEAQEPESPPSGVYGIKLSLSTNAQGFAASDPLLILFNFGLDQELFDSGVDLFATSLVRITGDFDANALITAADIDLLSAAIRDGANDSQFDLNDDQVVDGADRTTWVTEIAGTYFGDADLDGSVQFSDFVALATSFGEAGGWASGDFDGDRSVQFPDFVLLAENFGATNSVATAVTGKQAVAVPEPAFLPLFSVMMAVLLPLGRVAKRVTTAQNECVTT